MDTKKTWDDDSDEDDVEFQCEESSEEDEESEEEPEAKRRRIEHEEEQKQKVQSEADSLWEMMTSGKKTTPSVPSTPTTQSTVTSSRSTGTTSAGTKTVTAVSSTSTSTTTAKTTATSSSTPTTPKSNLAAIISREKKEEIVGVKTYKFAVSMRKLLLGPETTNEREKGSLKGKKKISTLDKSSLDWQQFKTQKGLDDELENQTKDGYLAKQAFLQRTDLREFEVERNVRVKARTVRDRKG